MQWAKKQSFGGKLQVENHLSKQCFKYTKFTRLEMAIYCHFLITCTPNVSSTFWAF